jgi:hypothetical protein
MSCKECDGNHSPTSAHLDFKIDNNGTWSDAVQFGTPPGYDWNLVGQNFELQVKRNRYDTTALLDMTTANGKIIVDDYYQRVIHFYVAPTEIQASLTPGEYVYDLVMADAANPALRVPLLHGVVEVEQGVTGP